MAKDNNLTDYLTDLADAIRAKKGTTGKINPQDFADEIATISGGGGASAGAVYEKDVNFRDYDGTLLHSYTKDEFLALSALPELPTREGLICQEWNWGFEEAQDYVADYGILEVGATYITDDGKTRLYFSIPTDNFTISFRFSASNTGGATFNWGDGAEEYVPAGTKEHTYAKKGEYCVSINVSEEGSIQLGSNSSSANVLGLSTSTIGYTRWCNTLKRVEMGERCDLSNSVFNICAGLKAISLAKGCGGGTYLFFDCISLSYICFPSGFNGGNYAFCNCKGLGYVSMPSDMVTLPAAIFSNCSGLQKATIPSAVTTISSDALQGCNILSQLVIPKGTTKIESRAFGSCKALQTVTIPEGVTSIYSNLFQSSAGLCEVVFPSNIKNISTSAFQYAYVSLFDFSKATVVPDLSNTNAFSLQAYTKIVVPDALYDEWIAATNWSTCASYIVKASQYFGGSTITFTIDGAEYQATEGMTWLEWCESEYNTEGWYADEWGVYLDVVIGESSWDYSEWKTISVDGAWGQDIPGTETIESGKAYLTYTNSDGVGGGGF